MYRETVTATTNCTGYVVSKYDMFNRLPRDHYKSIMLELQALEPPKSNLWDTTPHSMTEQDWKIKSVWANYKKDVLKSFYHPLTNRTPSILEKAKYVEKLYSRNTTTPANNTLDGDIFDEEDIDEV